MNGIVLLGVDIGTTGAKAVLIDATGAVVASATTEYPMFTPRPLWAEQDPEDWWRATVASIRSVLQQSGVSPQRVAGVALAGQMHGLVLLDAHGAVLRPCIMWNDQRTAAQCEDLTDLVGAQRVLELTGNPILPGFTAPKIAWVREHEPEVFARATKFLLPKDYVRYRLTGTMCFDVSDASGTSLFDVGRRQWSSEMLAALEIPASFVGDVAESPTLVAEVSAPGAEATGLKRGTPVAAGAGDQAAQAVGAGICAEGVTSVTLGTSGVVFAASDSYRVDPQGRLHAFCHAVPGMWHLMGVMLSAGGALRWYRDALCAAEVAEAARSGCDVYDLLTAAAAEVPAGSEGLIFLPYLAGERTPHPDPNARGVFFGLSLMHGKAHMTRSVLEGVAYGLRDSFELMRAAGASIERVRVSGGGARSALWRQILADVLNAPLETFAASEGAAYGAAILAGVGVGVFETVASACASVVSATASARPGPDRAVYARNYPHYRNLYPALSDAFARIGDPSRTQ